jgi:hypothetical protein
MKPELVRSGPFRRTGHLTEAISDGVESASIDAAEETFSEGELTAVRTLQKIATRFPSRKRVVL